MTEEIRLHQPNTLPSTLDQFVKVLKIYPDKTARVVSLENLDVFRVPVKTLKELKGSLPPIIP